MQYPVRRQVLAGLVGAAVAPLPALAQTAQPIMLTQAEGTQNRVALTFDDGPHPRLTPQLLDILAAYNARATFYVIGRNAARYPEILQRIVAEGHEIGNHTWSHPSLTGHGAATVLNELDRTNAAIAAATGFSPVTLRPPYGNLTPNQARMIYDARGLSTVLWSVDPLDWQRPGSQVVAQRILAGSRGGAVILSHDIHAPTVRAMPSVLDGLAARGLQTVQVAELMGQSPWPAPVRF